MNNQISKCLQLIDESLCCPICKEPFKIPVVIVSCSHNFCSLCIRRYLSIKQECPICGIDTTQGNLCPNWIIDGLLQRFVELRGHLNTVRSREDNESTEKPTFNNADSPITIDCTAQDKKPAPSLATTPTRPFSRSPKIFNEDSDVIESTPEFSLGLKDFNSPSQGFSLGTADISSTSKELFNSELQCDDEQNVSSKASTSSINATTESPRDTSDVKADCPVCGLSLSCKKMNAHLDSCLAREERKKALRPNTPKRQKLNNPSITKLAYNLLSSKELRLKMKEIGLLTNGDKQQLVRRHKEFYAKFHAEQDKRRPRRLSFILEEFEREENERRLDAERTTRNSRKRIILGLDSDSREGHLKKHAKHYKDLEEIVRKNLPRKCRKGRTKELQKDGLQENLLQKNHKSNDILHLSCDPTTSCEVAEPGSPELYVGPTPSECGLNLNTNDTSNNNLKVALDEDSQKEEVRNFIDASLI